MFLLTPLNRELITNGYDHFCQNYLDTSTTEIQDTINQYLIYTIVILGVYLLASCIFIITTSVELASLRKVIKLLEKQIRKDTIGKIFHTLSKKTEHEAVFSHISNMFSFNQIKPNSSIIGCIIIVSLMTCTCITLMFAEKIDDVTCFFSDM